MERLWEALDRRRERVIARGTAIVQRTRETGADILGRAEREASKLQGSLSSRRSALDGTPIERLERRVLERLEDVLERVGLGLRHRIQRLSPGASAAAIQPDAAPQPEDATLVEEPEPSVGATPRALEAASPPRDSAPRAAARATGKKRIRVAVGPVETPAPAAEPAAPTRASKGRASKSQRPAARRLTKPAAKASRTSSGATKSPKPSTRWVARPGAEEVEALGKLPVKTLLARIAELDDDACRALLAHEKQTKKRKGVVDALTARLGS